MECVSTGFRRGVLFHVSGSGSESARLWSGRVYLAPMLGQSAHKSGIMKKTTMSRTLQLGDTQVDEAWLADLCRRY